MLPCIVKDIIFK